MVDSRRRAHASGSARLRRMKITLACVGKMKASPEQELLRKYIRQTPWQITIHEIEVKKSLGSEQRKAAEAEQLLSLTAAAHRRVALDERGKTLSSEALASQFEHWRQQGSSHIGLIIGGADGLDESVRKAADLTVSFGAMTWPHMLVRAMLGEQLYRIHTILSGHPYHRS